MCKATEVGKYMVYLSKEESWGCKGLSGAPPRGMEPGFEWGLGVT